MAQAELLLELPAYFLLRSMEQGYRRGHAYGGNHAEISKGQG